MNWDKYTSPYELPKSSINTSEPLFIVVEKKTTGGHIQSTSIIAHEVKGEEALNNFFMKRSIDAKNFRVFKAEEYLVSFDLKFTKK